MPKRTKEYHSWLIERLSNPKEAAFYLNEARKDSKKIFLKALRNVAEAHRIARVAEETGLNRETLYRTLSENGNPSLETYDSVIASLGLDYDFRPKEIEAENQIKSGGNSNSVSNEVETQNVSTNITLTVSIASTASNYNMEAVIVPGHPNCPKIDIPWYLYSGQTVSSGGVISRGDE
ncbi:MAG TPA: addiction module antidote protein [Candidatus Acidoferrales bacterium]|jgi:probable addiction module antidote protein|nr:addiction module antidote protein [Candidatus Acidoferrales bacterium]